jgi:hypothetical protein
VVEHDFIMATYLADRVIVYEGQPSIDCTANCPQSLLTGMNLFLSVSVIIFQWFLYFLKKTAESCMLKILNYVVLSGDTCLYNMANMITVAAS